MLHQSGRTSQRWGAFTLIELLVTLSIIALLLSILIPSFSYIRYKARSIINVYNQRSIVTALSMYASDNRDRCPDSIAKVGFSNTWNWAEPTKLIGNNFQGPRSHRAMSEYLGQYIPEADVMYCANSPRPPYQYLKQAWQAGDNWDNPDTLIELDPLGGTLCYFWNYNGYQVERDAPIYGPRKMSGNNRFSRLLVFDYFGYDHWRSPSTFGSCERFASSSKIVETWLLSSYWAGPSVQDSNVLPDIKFNAAFIDGHVESYSSRDTIKMKVSLTPDGSVPYIDGIGPGTYFLPKIN